MKSNKKFLMFLLVMSMLFTVYENVGELMAKAEETPISEIQLSEHTVSVTEKKNNAENILHADVLQAGVEVVLHADIATSKKN